MSKGRPDEADTHKDQSLEAVLFDEKQNAFFIFFRTHFESGRTYRMVQTPDEKVFSIEIVFRDLPKGFEMGLVDSKNTSHQLKVQDYLENRSGTVNGFVAHSGSMRLFTDEPSWEPLKKDETVKIALGFGYFFSGSKLSSIPESWLAPEVNDYVYCDFSLKDGQMLALLTRTIGSKARKQKFVLALDQHNKMFLVKRCQLHGLFSKELVVDLCSREGNSRTLRL